MIEDTHNTTVAESYLSIGQKRVHSLKETRIQHVGFIHDERNLLIFATRAAQYCTKVLIEVLSSVLPVYLKAHTHTK